MTNPFNWGYLTTPTYLTPTWGPLSIAFVSIFGLGLVLSIVAYNDIGGRLRRNGLLYPTIQRATAISGVIFGLGLFFFLFRLLRVDAVTLNLRVWLYLAAFAALVEAGYYGYWTLAVYPKLRKSAAAEELKRRYLVPAVAGGSSNRRRRSRGKKKR